MRAFARAYGLAFPDAPDGADDTWKNLRANNAAFLVSPGKNGRGQPLPSPCDVCEGIAYNHGVLHLVSVLRDGAKIAQKRGREVQWKDVAEAQDLFDRLSAKKNV